MALPLVELPAELFHAALVAAGRLAEGYGWQHVSGVQARLRSAYAEADTRLALMARLTAIAQDLAGQPLKIENWGVALWLSALADRSGESRDRTACAAADPQLGRLLLTMRAAGLAPAEAERQALQAQPDALLPRGLQDIGTREAAQWLAEARA
jgi:hypothetical protein